MNVILKMFFLIFNNSNKVFANRQLIWKSYSMYEALLTTLQVEFINNKKFAKMVLDEDIKVFIVYVFSLSLKLMIIYSA